MDPLRSTSTRYSSFHPRADRRRSRRCVVPDLFVTLAGTNSDVPRFAANAIDISEEGLALAMTPDVEVGREVLVSFELGGRSYESLPAVVLRRDAEYGVGVLHFRGWPPGARRSLANFIEC